MADGDASAKPFLGRTLATVAAFFSIAATAISAIGAWSADQAKIQAEKTQAAFEESKLVKDYQIKVFEIVDKSLSAEQGSLVMASAYVSSLDDAKLQAALIQAIRVVATARQKVNKLSIEEAEALGALKETAQRAAVAQIENSIKLSDNEKAAATLANPLSENGVTQAQMNQKSINPIGWDVDVFWCVGRGDTSRNLAATIAEDLATQADARTPVGGQVLGRVRVRQLTDASADAGNLPKNTNEVRADDGEETIADALANAASARTDEPFVRKTSGAGTKWYVSLFACGS